MQSVWRSFWNLFQSKEDQPLITDEYIAALRQRNHERAQQCIKELGKKWLLHPEYSKGSK